MARIRTIKPEMGSHEGLYDLELETGLPIRFAWAMLPTACDREGRFKWLPRTLKAQLLPHDPIEFSRVLDAWLTRGFIVKYRVGNEWFGWLPTFRKHQVINPRESQSAIPAFEDGEQVEDYRNQKLADASSTREISDSHASSTLDDLARGEGKGKEGKGKKKPPSPSSTKKAPAFDATTLPLPQWLPAATWGTWVESRRSRGKPISEIAAKQQINDLWKWRKAGHDPIAIIETSIRNDWQGLIEPRPTGAAGTQPPAAEQRPLRMEDITV